MFGIEIILGVLVFAVNIYLGILVFSRDTKNWTNRLFLILAILINAYVITNFISLHPTLINSHDQLFWIRIVMFVTSFIGPSLFFLVYVFPRHTARIAPVLLYPILALMILSAGLSLSPYVFTDLQYIGGQPIPTPGPGIFVFMLDFIGLFIASFVVLILKLRKENGPEHPQIKTIFYGVLVSFSLMGFSTVISVVVFHTSSSVFLGPLYSLFLISAIFYAILHYNLFNIKVFATQIFVVAIGLIYLTKYVLAASIADRIVDGSIFIVTMSFGILLIRSVQGEVRARQEIEGLMTNLHEANKHLKDLDQRKSEFLSLASHQLRTPLTAIKGYSSLVLEGAFGKIPKQAIGAIERIFESSKWLVTIVDDFLTISRIEQNRLHYIFEQIDLYPLLESLAHEMTLSAGKKGLTLTFEKKGATCCVLADGEKLKQVIANLIDNSIKYTTAGGITLSTVEDPHHHSVLITITDTGIGMSVETLDLLFKKFSRAMNASKMNTGGSGLGLYISRRIIEEHSGRIWAESAGEGKGSSFFIELPLDTHAQHAAKQMA